MIQACQNRKQRGQSLGILLFIVACIIAGWGIFYSIQKMPVDTEHSGFNQALQTAESEENHVLLVFTASWCGPCQKMKRDVYPDSRVRSAATNYQWLTIDVDQSSNRELSQKFGIRGIPAHVIVDHQGSKVASRSGSCSVDDFAAWLKKHRP